MTNPKISIIGVGYVGLCTAVGFASKGYTVISSDIDAEKVKKITSGIPPFYEPSLNEMLSAAIQNGNLKCLVNSIQDVVLDTSITYIAVGTPSRSDGSIDLTFIETAAKEIGKALKQKDSYHIVVVKSTVIPGTTQTIIKAILESQSEKRCGKDFGLCMNPEFLRQGSAFSDTFHPDRIVIGSYDNESGNIMEDLYRNFYCDAVPPIVKTSLSTAELIKYASNSLLATKISFINTIANICEKIPDADVETVAEAVGLDKRIGPLFLNAGLGYGGSCFPKDVKALIACSKKLGYDASLLDSVEHVNNMQPLRAIELLKEQLNNLEGKNIAILGLAFKPDTDDMREARVVPIINQLLKEGATVQAYDPVAMPIAKGIFQNRINYSVSAINCLKNADAVILVTEWSEFKSLTPSDFLTNMRQPILIDGRRAFNPLEYNKELKFRAIGLGELSEEDSKFNR